MTIKTLFLKTPNKTNLKVNGTGNINNISNTVYGLIAINGEIIIEAPEIEITKLEAGGQQTINGDSTKPVYRLLEGSRTNGQFSIDSRTLDITNLIHEGSGRIINCSGTIDYLQTTGGVTVDGDVHIKHIVGGGSYTLEGDCVVDLVEITSGMVTVQGNAQVKEIRVVQGGFDYLAQNPTPSKIYIESGGGTYSSRNNSTLAVVGGGVNISDATLASLLLDGGNLTVSGDNSVTLLKSNYTVNVTPGSSLTSSNATIAEYSEESETLPNLILDPSVQVDITRQVVDIPEMPELPYWSGSSASLS